MSINPSVLEPASCLSAAGRASGTKLGGDVATGSSSGGGSADGRAARPHSAAAALQDYAKLYNKFYGTQSLMERVAAAATQAGSASIGTPIGQLQDGYPNTRHTQSTNVKTRNQATSSDWGEPTMTAKSFPRLCSRPSLSKRCINAPFPSGNAPFQLLPFLPKSAFAAAARPHRQTLTASSADAALDWEIETRAAREARAKYLTPALAGKYGVEGVAGARPATSPAVAGLTLVPRSSAPPLERAHNATDAAAVPHLLAAAVAAEDAE
eukprot:359260-Chlamydomonas_euryale.AAC.1